MLMASSSSDVIVVMLKLLSSFLRHSWPPLRAWKDMATAFRLLIMIIHIGNTIACVAVNEMVRLSSIEFWFDFVRLDTSGIGNVRSCGPDYAKITSTVSFCLIKVTRKMISQDVKMQEPPAPSLICR